MATNLSVSRSIRKGQAAIVCQLCEIEPKLNWKCLECGLMMCQRCCDKVHPKFPSAKDHTVINIKDIGKYKAESKPKPNFTKLVCGIHKTQKCCMFCKSCDIIVCPECISKTHKRHDLIELGEGYDIKITKITKGQECIDSAIHSLTDSEAELFKIKYLEGVSYKRTRQGILSYEKHLSNSVKEYINKILNEADNNWKLVEKSINGEELKLKKNGEGLTKQRDQVNDLLQSHDADKVFSTPATLIQSTQPNSPVNTIFNHVAEFVPGDKSIIPKLVGSLKSVSSLYNPVPKVIQQYTTDLSRCTNLKACPDGSFWINDEKLQQVQKVNPTREEKMIVKSKLNIDINDISLMANGDLLLCMEESSVLKIIPVGAEEIKDSAYNLSPLRAISIHVTEDNKVIAGVADTRRYFPASGPRHVVVMDQAGKQEQVYQYDNHNKQIFTLPICIQSNKSNIIGVIDCLSEDAKGRIVVLERKGVIKNIYTGHPKINSEENLFKPTNLLSLPSDNFLIVEPTNNYLHILNSHGHILTFYSLEEMGIKFPFSMSFMGHLFIGGTKDGSGKKAIVYKVDNFVW